MNTEILEANSADIEELRQEIDRLDAEILAAVKRRAEVPRPSARSEWLPAAPDWCTAAK